MDPQNPFAAILARAQGGQDSPQEQPMAPQQAPGAPSGALAQASQQVENPEEPQEDQLNPGQNPDNTQNLMGALRSLETYIRQSDDREEIMTARGIISLLSRLIAKDQEKMASKT